MAERGHRGSWDECKMKIKSLILNKSGNNMVTCPYYDDLDWIIKGDPSMKSGWVSQSLQRDTVPRPPVLMLPEAAIDLFPLGEEETFGEETEGSNGSQG